MTLLHLTRSIRVYMRQLRHRLERNPSRTEFLMTEPGAGYRLKRPGVTGPSLHFIYTSGSPVTVDSRCQCRKSAKAR